MDGLWLQFKEKKFVVIWKRDLREKKFAPIFKDKNFKNLPRKRFEIKPLFLKDLLQRGRDGKITVEGGGEGTQDNMEERRK